MNLKFQSIDNQPTIVFPLIVFLLELHKPCEKINIPKSFSVQRNSRIFAEI